MGISQHTVYTTISSSPCVYDRKLILGSKWERMRDGLGAHMICTLLTAFSHFAETAFAVLAPENLCPELIVWESGNDYTGNYSPFG